MTQQDTIHEQDRSSDDEASTTTSSSSEDKGPQPKGLLRRSVLWGHNVRLSCSWRTLQAMRSEL